MSEKEKEKNDNEGEILLHHFYHEHPLRLTVVGHRAGVCYGCTAYISPREKAYTCRDCGSTVILHEECAEMPREITLSSHPQHSLIQKEVSYVPECAVCERSIYRIGYYCSSSGSCKFQVHLRCANDIKIMKSNINIKHPSHPHHHLTLLLKSSSFKCDACGTIHEGGSSYICNDCPYWIHESCAALPPTRDFHHLHRHVLSLSYHVPLEYIRFDFKCRICFKIFFGRYWVYHCEICRYVVHINCAIHTNSVMLSNINANTDEGEDVVLFPTINTVEEMIGSFVAKVGEAKGEYKLHNSDHQLQLVSSSVHDQEEEEDDGDDRDELLYYGNKSEVVCDGCAMPILDKKQKKFSHIYISCGECKYFLHLACSHLPPVLPSHPLHHQSGHILTLQSCPKLNFVYCDICGFYTNGLFYKCTKCSFEADVKCVSLPDTIKHESHPQHRLKLLTKLITRDFSYYRRVCGACGDRIYNNLCYNCDICEFILHSSCCLLPAVVTDPTWDKHPIPLTFDASVDHPSSFYCEVCELEMNPMMWMYHCRDCDISVHPKCFPTASGEYRNIKLGQRYLVDAVHNHPLAFQLLTKLHCNVCSKRVVYGKLGFQCDSDKCEFAMCWFPCSEKHRDAMHAIDD